MTAIITTTITTYLAIGVSFSVLLYIFGDDEIKDMHDSAPGMWLTDTLLWPGILWAVIGDLYDAITGKDDGVVIVYDEDRPLRDGEGCFHVVVESVERGKKFGVHLHMDADDLPAVHAEAQRLVRKHLAELANRK